jgi:hypothetical protein
VGLWTVRRQPEGLIEVARAGDRSSVMFAGLREAVRYLLDRLEWGDQVLTEDNMRP